MAQQRLRVLGWVTTGAVAGLIGGFVAGLVRSPATAADQAPSGGGR